MNQEKIDQKSPISTNFFSLYKKSIIIFFLLLFIIFLATGYFIYSKYLVKKSVYSPKNYCDIFDKVYECDNGIIKIDENTSELGVIAGVGTSYVKNDIKTSCPVVGPQYISKECKNFPVEATNCKPFDCFTDNQALTNKYREYSDAKQKEYDATPYVPKEPEKIYYEEILNVKNYILRQFDPKSEFYTGQKYPEYVINMANLEPMYCSPTYYYNHEKDEYLRTPEGEYTDSSGNLFSMNYVLKTREYLEMLRQFNENDNMHKASEVVFCETKNKGKYIFTVMQTSSNYVAKSQDRFQIGVFSPDDKMLKRVVYKGEGIDKQYFSCLEPLQTDGNNFHISCGGGYFKTLIRLDLNTYQINNLLTCKTDMKEDPITKEEKIISECR